jgi:hypothetical protein
VLGLPLTKAVSFEVRLQKGNRFQVPRLVRWEFKMESKQVLKILVRRAGAYGQEEWFGRMNVDGRITIPKLTLSLLQDEPDEKSLVGNVLEVTLLPSGQE